MGVMTKKSSLEKFKLYFEELPSADNFNKVKTRRKRKNENSISRKLRG